MKLALIGSGKIGTALARRLVREGIEVAIANSRGPDTLASYAEQLGPSVHPTSVQDACGADLLFLAVPFSAHRDVAQQLNEWHGKLVVDMTNAFHVAPEELGDRLSTEVLAEVFPGARIVKAFNHLPAAQLGTDLPKAQKQVIFVSSNDPEAASIVSAFVSRLGFAPVELGRIDQGGVPLHVVGGKPGGLLLQNLAKLA